MRKSQHLKKQKTFEFLFQKQFHETILSQHKILKKYMKISKKIRLRKNWIQNITSINLKNIKMGNLNVTLLLFLKFNKN